MHDVRAVRHYSNRAVLHWHEANANWILPANIAFKTMIKLIPTEKLQTGMSIHDLNCGWMDHNFVRSRFAVKTEAVALKVRALGVKEIYIDTARGLDIVEGPSQEAQEHQVDAALQALATTSASDMPRVSVQREVERAQKLHGDANRIVRDVMGDVRLGKQIQLEQIEPLVARIVDSIFRRADALMPLARLKEHDEYTFQHSVSVCVLMTSFARALELPREIIHEIAIGALLHDVGKAKVADEILNKPAKLTDAEFAKMKNHVVQSKIILQATPGISNIALDVAAQHHERFDGTGYPNKLKGEEISLYGQMGAIVDVYDAITSNRVYHKGMMPTDAMRKLLEWEQVPLQTGTGEGLHPRRGHLSDRLPGAAGKPAPGGGAGAKRRSGDAAGGEHDLPTPAATHPTPEIVHLRRSHNRIVGHEDFATWNIDPLRWLPE